MSLSTAEGGRPARPLLTGLLLYLTLKPFYFWDSGLPQVSDLILVLTILHSAISSETHTRHRKTLSPLAKASIAFAAYATAINLISMLLTGGDTDFVFSSLFHVYNAIALIWILDALNGSPEQLARTLAMGTVAGVSSQMIIVLATGGLGEGRAIGTFNNPNQLGYYGVLCASLLLASSRVVAIRNAIMLLGVVASFVIALASLSKAAIGAMAILLVGLTLFGPSGATRGNLSARALALAVGLLAYLGVPRIAWLKNRPEIQAVIQRFGGDENDSSLASRGYDRIIDYPQYWIFGSGEGDYRRFGSGIEIHSLPANLQVSYGIVGFALFGLMLFIALRRAGMVGWYIMAAPILYGLTHNGIRNTLLWMLLAIVYAGASRRPSPGPNGDDKAWKQQGVGRQVV